MAKWGKNRSDDAVEFFLREGGEEGLEWGQKKGAGCPLATKREARFKTGGTTCTFHGRNEREKKQAPPCEGHHTSGGKKRRVGRIAPQKRRSAPKKMGSDAQESEGQRRSHGVQKNNNN